MIHLIISSERKLIPKLICGRLRIKIDPPVAWRISHTLLTDSARFPLHAKRDNQVIIPRSHMTQSGPGKREILKCVLAAKPIWKCFMTDVETEIF